MVKQEKAEAPEKAIEDNEKPVLDITPPSPAEEVATPEDAKFAAEVDKLIRAAEEKRLHYMRQMRNRGFFTLIVTLGCVMAGGAAFGWFFLMEGNLPKALACIGLAAAIPFLCGVWARSPRKAYAKNYKREFMPQMAQVLGRLKFYPERGIGAKILPHTGIIPKHTRYEAEDCFMGSYHGVKIIFSEAHLFRGEGPVFDGIFVYLEIPGAKFPGHTIITGDERAVKSWRGNRWQKFHELKIGHAEYAAHFQVFATKPEPAAAMVSAQLLKEMLEMSALFDKSPLSAAFFAENRVFLAIPHEIDMFEPSQIEMPVTTQAHALRCKKEVEQIVSIIDVIEIYGKKS